MNEEKPVCQRCRYYFVTWQADFPHGCKAFDMKSKTLPCLEVQIISKQDCLKFEPKV
jgi:hypothetical protein